ncbi:MAG: hypothetical protein ACN4GW_06610 [Desulforhopalus sp.]
MVKSRKTVIHFEFPEDPTADLRGRQSVRTTFKLSERSIDALSILAGQLGIKQKSLFDHLVEDTRALAMIAREFEDFSGRSQRVAKTYVVSRKSLENLEKVADQYNTPRDALVEYSIEKIIPLLKKEREKHEHRKKLLAELRDYLDTGLEMLERTEADLDRDDPVFREMMTMVRAVNNCCDRVDSCVEKGSKIEEFNSMFDPLAE